MTIGKINTVDLSKNQPSNDVFGGIVANELGLRLEGQKFELRPFWKSKREYLANAGSQDKLYYFQHRKSPMDF